MKNKFVSRLLTLALVLCFAGFAATAQTASKSKSKSKSDSSMSSDKSASSSSGKSSSSGAQIDINSASKDELVKNLAGVGDVTADKIIAGRPYANKRKVVSKGIVKTKVYEKISSQIIAKQGASAAPASSSGKPSTTTDSTSTTAKKKKK
jgi:DNA uptake protein ComE-like DNA-binding protein